MLIKKSITLNRHRTSIALEPAFWRALEHIAERDGLPIAHVISKIDEARIGEEGAGSLASAVRVWLLRAGMEAANDE